jgi:hypothetical protein
LMLAGVAIPFVLALLGLDYFETRNLLALWLPFAVVVAAGLVLVGGRTGPVAVGALAVLGLMAVIAVDVTPNWRRDDWRGMARALGKAPTLRAVVVTPANGAVPLRLYREGLRPMPAHVVSLDQVALLSKGKRTTGSVHPPKPPRPRKPAIPGFTVIKKVYADDYSMVLLQGGGVGVTPASLANYRLLRGKTSAAVLLQPAGR